MPITEQDVVKIAILANLELTVEERESFTTQLSAIVTYIDKLNELETTSIEPMSHCTVTQSGPEYAERDDSVTPCLGQKAVLKNAPDPERGYFKVPKVIG